MLKEAVNLTGVEAFFAETDVDAVGFYKKCGFVCEKQLNHYEDGDVERFECYLKAEKQKYSMIFQSSFIINRWTAGRERICQKRTI